LKQNFNTPNKYDAAESGKRHGIRQTGPQNLENCCVKQGLEPWRFCSGASCQPAMGTSDLEPIYKTTYVIPRQNLRKKSEVGTA